jgi:hypothetical protein
LYEKTICPGEQVWELASLYLPARCQRTANDDAARSLKFSRRRKRVPKDRIRSKEKEGTRHPPAFPSVLFSSRLGLCARRRKRMTSNYYPARTGDLPRRGKTDATGQGDGLILIDPSVCLLLSVIRSGGQVKVSFGGFAR